MSQIFCGIFLFALLKKGTSILYFTPGFDDFFCLVRTPFEANVLILSLIKYLHNLC